MMYRYLRYISPWEICGHHVECRVEKKHSEAEVKVHATWRRGRASAKCLTVGGTLFTLAA